MFPAARGAASSMQAFIGLLANALMAGLVSPWLSGNLFHLALAAGALSVLAWLFWRWEHLRRPRAPNDADEARALEPMNP